MTDRKDFIDTLNDMTLVFPDNGVSHRILAGEFTLSDYHAILLSLFHSAYEGPAISALAASHCPEEFEPAREALLTSAAEGGAHWHWILNDLESSGFHGPDPRTTFANTEAQAYVSYNYYIAMKAPAARLGIIAVMESLAANFGANYSAKLFQCLNLKASQASFFYRRERRAPAGSMIDVLDTLPMTERDWQWMVNATRTAATLYRAIYDAR